MSASKRKLKGGGLLTYRVLIKYRILNAKFMLGRAKSEKQKRKRKERLDQLCAEQLADVLVNS